MMIIEYDFIVNVEIQSETEEEQKELRKKFKQELYREYGDNEIMRITNIKRYKEKTGKYRCIECGEFIG